MTSEMALGTEDLPYITNDLPGIGGQIKRDALDFIVEEIPAYLPSGSGEHLFLWIEKEGVSSEELLKHVSRCCQVPPRDIGSAAMKDRHAVTRQFVSIPARQSEGLRRLEFTNERGSVRLLHATRHTNKLRTGHLKGNRFSILLRDVAADAHRVAEQVVERIRQFGVPNYFGDQRFGYEGDTARLGLSLLRGTSTPDDIPPSKRRFLLKLALSAGQSVLFNRVLAERLQEGLLHRVLVGDVLQVEASGGLFLCEDSGVDQVRRDAGEVVPTGPMYGPKMKSPAAEVLQREMRVLGLADLSETDFCRYPELTQGTRRPLSIRPQELRLQMEDEGLRFQFDLPSGCYATVLLREFQKQAVASDPKSSPVP